MPLERTSRIRQVKELTREQAAHRLNLAAQQHVNFSQLVVPVKSGKAQKSIKQLEQATPQNLRTEVVAGGREAPYFIFIELGFTHYKSGQRIPGQFPFQQGLEAGRRHLQGFGVRAEGIGGALLPLTADG